jgi:hypothetical protein
MAKWLHDIQTPYCLYDYIHYQHSVILKIKKKAQCRLSTTKQNGKLQESSCCCSKIFRYSKLPTGTNGKTKWLTKTPYRLPELLSAQSTDYDRQNKL